MKKTILIGLWACCMACGMQAQVRVASFPEKSLEQKDDYRVSVTSHVTHQTVEVPLGLRTRKLSVTREM